MSLRLRDLIKAVRGAKTAAEERSIIQKEAAMLRTEFSKDSPVNRQRNIAKLLYMNTLGYPTKWGQMECIKLIASPNYLDKRIGYLSVNILLDENQEVLMLATHQIKTDLKHSNKFIAGLALCTLGNIASEQICRDCAPEIEQLMSEDHVDPYIRKKAVLCAVKILRKVPDLVDSFAPTIKGLLQEADHGVLICVITLMIELCKLEDQTHKKFFQQKYVGGLVRILRNIHKSGYAPEYDVGGIADPFLQVKILKLLRLLGQDSKEVSDRVNEVLAMIATNTDTLRNVGNSILYECVSTIMNIQSDQDLRVMAINTLGKFLSNKDNNIRYVALFTLCGVVDVDTEAVQRDRGKIVDCLKDSDRSIRRRALHLIYSLVDDSNVRNLVRELLAVLLKADLEFRAELTAKLCYVSQKYAPSPSWLIDTLLKIMAIAGEYVPEQFQNHLIGTITRHPDLHAYAVQKMYASLVTDLSQDVLNQVSAWCLGEYGDLLINTQPTENGQAVSAQDIIEILEKILIRVGTSLVTKEYILTALFKLSTRIPHVENDIVRLISGYKSNIHVELQQRACEYLAFFQSDPAKRQKILEKLPPIPEPTDKEAYSTFKGGKEPEHKKKAVNVGDATSSGPAIIDLLGTGPVSSPTTGTSDIINLFDTTTTTPSTSGTADILGSLFAPAPTSSASSGLGGLQLGGMMGGFGAPMGGTPPGGMPLGGSPFGAVPGFGSPLGGVSMGGAPLGAPLGGLPLGGAPLGAPVPVAQAGGIPPMAVFQNSDLSASFTFRKVNPANPALTHITLTVNNTSSAPFDNFVFQAAPPRHAKYALEPASALSIPPGGTLTQGIRANNQAYGQKGLSMKCKFSYTVHGQPVDIEHIIKEFPAGM